MPFRTRGNLPHIGDGGLPIDMLSRWGVGCSLCSLVYVEGYMRLRDHFLPHASFHRAWSRLPGETRSHLPLPELRSSNLPFPILPEKYRTVSPSKRCSAQSYSICAFADKYETSALVCIVLKSNSTDIFTDPLRGAWWLNRRRQSFQRRYHQATSTPQRRIHYSPGVLTVSQNSKRRSAAA